MLVIAYQLVGNAIVGIPTPHWLVILLLGALITPVTRVGYLSLRYLFTHISQDALEGTWQSYAPNYRGEGPDFRRYRWSISKSFVRPGTYTASAVSCRNPKMKYKGVAFYERQYVLMELKAVHDDEYVYIRICRSAPTLSSELVGLSLKHDHKARSSAGPIVMSRDANNEERAREMIARSVRVDNQNRVLYVMEGG